VQNSGINKMDGLTDPDYLRQRAAVHRQGLQGVHSDLGHDPRLNSAIGYITPKDMLAGRQQEIHADRDRKLEAARQQRHIRRQSAA
jgi:hypothetical protein